MSKKTNSVPERRPAKNSCNSCEATEKNSMPRYKNPPPPPPKKEG